MEYSGHPLGSDLTLALFRRLVFSQGESYVRKVVVVRLPFGGTKTRKV